MRTINFNSIATKLFLIILVAVLPLLVLSLYTANQEREGKIEAAKNDARHYAVMAAESQQEMVEKVVDLLAAAAAGKLAIADPETCSTFLGKLLFGKTEYVNLLILRTDGTVFCSAYTPVEWLPDPVVLDHVLRTEGIYFVRNQASESNEMVFLSRLVDSQEILIGVGVVNMRPSWLIDQAGALQETHPGSAIMVVDAAGTVLNASTLTEKGSQSILNTPLLAAIRLGQTSIQTMGLDGVERFYGINRLAYGPGGSTAYVLAGLPVTTMIQAANAQLQLDLMVIGFSLLVSLVAALATQKRLVIHWVQPLIRTAQRIEAGDYSARTSMSKSKSELGHLARAIDSMAEMVERTTAELRETGVRYYNLFTGVPVGLYRTTPEGRILDANPALKNMLGIPDSELGGMLNVSTFFVDPDDRQRWTDAMDKQSEIIDFELHLRRLDGESIIVLDKAKPVRDAKGMVQYYEGSMLDITQREQIRQALHQSYAHLNSVLNSIAEAYIALDSEWRFLEVNPVASRDIFAGRPASDLIGKMFWEEYPQAVQSEFYHQYQTAVNEGRSIHFEAQSALNGHWWETHAYPSQEKLEVYLRDITERKQNEAFIREMAYHDPLTGLYNRKAFQERLEQELVRARRHGGKFAVLYLDLDNFKVINDHFGHETGDQVLCTVAHRLQDELRTSDIAARIGGDEFTILLTDLKDSDDPNRVANRISLNTKKPLTIEGNTVEVSTSIGISLYPEDGNSAKELLNKADQSMFRKKRKREIYS